MLHRFCNSCRVSLYAADKHGECVSCLGTAHAETALTRMECHHCGDMSLSSLRSWLAFFSESNPAACALSLFSSQGPAEDFSAQRWVCFRRLKTRVPHSLPTERFIPFSSPALTSIPLWLRAIWSRSVGAMTASWTTARHWQLQIPRSWRALTTTPPPRCLCSPAHPAQRIQPRHGRQSFLHSV